MSDPLRIRLLGCHHTETATARLSSYLVNDRLALDAGALSSTLTQKEQDNLAGIVVTHLHFDHNRDLLTVGLGGFETGLSLPVYGTAETLDYLHENFLNGRTYPDFTVRPSTKKPRLQLTPLEPWKEHDVAGLAFPTFSRLSVPGATRRLRRSSAARYRLANCRAAGSRPKMSNTAVTVIQMPATTVQPRE
jgi:hypothetical protein